MQLKIALVGALLHPRLQPIIISLHLLPHAHRERARAPEREIAAAEINIPGAISRLVNTRQARMQVYTHREEAAAAHIREEKGARESWRIPSIPQTRALAPRCPPSPLSLSFAVPVELACSVSSVRRAAAERREREGGNTEGCSRESSASVSRLACAERLGCMWVRVCVRARSRFIPGGGSSLLTCVTQSGDSRRLRCLPLPAASYIQCAPAAIPAFLENVDYIA